MTTKSSPFKKTSEDTQLESCGMPLCLPNRITQYSNQETDMQRAAACPDSLHNRREMA